jgi:UDP-glucose 4-epimerase
MAGADMVFHLAANADVRFGTEHPRKDLEQNTIATFNVLEAMRAGGVSRIAFASTGSVYGEPSVFPTPEDAPFPTQTSLYGASKLAGEGLISAYCEGFGFTAHIFRFVSILGERYSHGHVADFHRQLVEHPDRLHVLGDGRQRKSYLYVQDCIEAMLTAVGKATGKLNVFNLGTDEHCDVNQSVAWICEHLGLSPKVTYGGGARGWVGDSPFIFLDCRKIRGLGWTPGLSIKEGILRTLRYLQGEMG